MNNARAVLVQKIANVMKMLIIGIFEDDSD